MGEAEVSVPQASLALSPLQTPSADLFHYDSMNAVNWGMRGECGLLGTRGDCAQLWPDPQQTMAPRWALSKPKFPLPFVSHSLPPPTSLIFPSPWPWVVAKPSVPSGPPEPPASTVVPLLLSWTCLPAPEAGKTHSEPNARCSQQKFHERWVVCQQCSPGSFHRPYVQAQAGGQPTSELGDSPLRWRG